MPLRGVCTVYKPLLFSKFVTGTETDTKEFWIRDEPRILSGKTKIKMIVILPVHSEL